MVKVPRKTVLLLLGVLILLSLAVRYPLVEHERLETDSYFVHILTKSIVDHGRALWTFNPLSYFGLFPYSYPSGVPFVYAELSEMTGLTIESTILLANMMMSTLFCLAVFVLARQFIMKPEWILLATFFAVLGARFVDTTYWDGSARGPFVILLTLAIAVALRASTSRKPLLYVAAIAIGATTFAVHHMSVLLMVIGVAYIVSSLVLNYVLPRTRLRKRAVAIGLAILVLAALAVVALMMSELARAPERTGLAESSLFDVEPQWLSIILNIGSSYTNQIGFILVFALFASIRMFRRCEFLRGEMFLFMVIVSFVPLIERSIYISMIIGPFIAILGTSWIGRVWDSTRRKSVLIAVMMALILSSVAVTSSSTSRWNEEMYKSGDTVEVGDQIFNDASYMRLCYPGVEAISNTNVQMLELYALSDCVFLNSDIYAALSGDAKKENLDIQWADVRFPTIIYAGFIDKNRMPIDTYVSNLFQSGIGGEDSAWAGVDYFASNEKLLIVVDNHWNSSYVSQYGSFTAALLKPPQRQIESSSPPLTSYVVYKSGGLTLYATDLNS